MATKKIRIETEKAPPSTGFRSQGIIAGEILFTGGQIGAAMPEPGVLREPTVDMAESVRIALGHLEQVTLAAELDRSHVFEVSAFPKVAGTKDSIYQDTIDFLGLSPELFNYHEVADVAMHAQIEMDWMATVGSRDSAVDSVRLLGGTTEGEAVQSGPFVIWNGLQGHGSDLSQASANLLEDVNQRLQAIGGELDDLVKLTIYLYAFDPYPTFNEVTKQYFAEIIPPTRSVLVAPDITGDAKVVMDVLAVHPASHI